MNLQILYEDNHLLGVYKPAGVLVQGDATGDPTLLDLAKSYIAERYAKPGNVYLGLVHRLDRPVAGVVLFARTSKAAGRLSKQFRERTVEKVYWAIVEGRPKPPRGVVTDYVSRERRRSQIQQAATEGAKLAELRYRTLETRARQSLLEVSLGTGRHHQIRAQLAHHGHPIVGDVKYGASAALPKKRIALLAKRLIVSHPTRDETVKLESPVPGDWPW